MDSYYLDESSLVDWLENSTNHTLDIFNLLNLYLKIDKNKSTFFYSVNLNDVNIGFGNKFIDVRNFQLKDVSLSRDDFIKLNILFKFFNQPINPELHQVNYYDKDSEEIKSTMESRVFSAFEIINAEGGLHEPCIVRMGSFLDNSVHSIGVEGFDVVKVSILHLSDFLHIYHRHTLLSSEIGEDVFFDKWDSCFPKLLKHPDLSFNKFDGSFQEILKDVVSHLIFLNDHFLVVMNQEAYDIPRAMQRADAEHGISFSNESSSTKRAQDKIKLRDVKFNDRVVRCELHTKIERTRNRIHFHAPVPEIDPNKILIGIFVDHLDT